MLRKEQHRKYMFDVLKEIYNSHFSKNLAFKWGTLCYFLYWLDRFSTDLDFDIVWELNEEELFNEINKILSKKWVIKESYNKRFTIFFLFSYWDTDMNIKLEINKRILQKNKYIVQNFFWTDILVMEKSTIFANKLVALTDRKKIVNRDLYDIYFFYKNNFLVNEFIIFERTWKTYKEYLVFLLDFIKNMNSNNLLDWLGEVLDNKQKAFVKEKLIKELIGIIEFNLAF